MASFHMRSGNILDDDADVLVCPTNSLGVMGKGLAKQFRERFKGLFIKYQRHCKNHDLNDMVPFVDRRSIEPTIYCLHTKRHWREDSSRPIVGRGFRKLITWCVENEIATVAIPELGCGNGNLSFEEDVFPIIKQVLSTVAEPLEVRIYRSSL